MLPNTVRQVFEFGLTSYFRELLVNNQDFCRKNFVQDIFNLHVAMRTCVAESLPTELRRNVVDQTQNLATGGSDLFFRRCRLHPRGFDELIVMLAMDASNLPKSCRTSIDRALASSTAFLAPVRLLAFVLTKGNGVVFQLPMLLAAKNKQGDVVIVPHHFDLKVKKRTRRCIESRKAFQQKSNELFYLLHLVMSADAVTLHEATAAENRTRLFH